VRDKVAGKGRRSGRPPWGAGEGVAGRSVRFAATALLVAWLLIGVGAPGAYCSEGVFYKEAQLIGAYSDEDEWMGEIAGQSNSLGFEDYRRFSNAGGDFLTTDIQARLALYASRSRDVWGIEIHNAYAAYRVAFGHRLRAGHFDVPFGLEPVVDTHGTLLQTLAMATTGFKQDWGIGLKGGLAALDYEVGAQLGSGMAIRRRDGSYLLAARLGTPSDGNISCGASLLYGRVLESMGMETFPANHLMSDDAVPKRLAGLDGQYLYGPVLLRGEVIYGESGGSPVLGYLAQADCTVPQDQNWHVELQFQSWTGDLARERSDRSSGAACLSYRLNESSTVRVALIQEFEAVDSGEATTGVIQLYYYGN
jgi:hypothetical protein